ncbi:hypothetical protein HY633_05320 [Candidatus Uhrbacteria bacterium]|nr:hypothetical protein [Candidatus Uhrbacteria bacterium]
MNFLTLIWLFLTANLQEIQAWTDREILARARGMRRLFYFTFLIPIGLMVMGIRAGTLGDAEYAQTTALIAGFLAALIALIFMVRKTFYATVLVIASVGISHVSNRIPTLDAAATEKFTRWVWGVCAWVMLVASVSQFIPYWENIGATIALCTVGMAAVAMTIGWGLKTSFLRNAAVVYVAVVAVKCLYSFAPQGMKDGVSQVIAPATALLSSEGAKVSSLAMRRSAANGVNLTADETKARLTRQLLQKLQNRQAQIIREDLAADCTGFCTPEREEEHRLNQGKILAIQDGSFWESALSSPPPKPAPPAPPPPVKLAPTKSEAQRLLQEKYPETLKD